MSELKRLTGSNGLPAGMLASESEEIKDDIHGFDDA